MGYKIEKCEICQKSAKEIGIEIPGSYYIKEKLKKHVEEIHGVEFQEYLEEYCKVPIPTCRCGCGMKVAAKLGQGGPIEFNNFILFHDNSSTPGHKAFSEKMKVDRKGAGNPMYQKRPWNFEKTKENDPRMKIISDKQTGRKLSEITLEKLRLAYREGAFKNLIHNMPHTEEAKEKIRQKTLVQIQRGCFSQLKSSCHIAMTKILQDLGVDFTEEKVVGVFSYDIFLPKYGIYIEADGDYWHVNPKFYPDGPKTIAQKVNFYRDKRKDQFSLERGLIVYRFWEDEIKNNLLEVVKRIREILCKHQK